MKTKICALCKVEGILMFRINISNDKTWIFVCKSCCITSKKLGNYKYGGTWKGSSYS